MAIVITHHCQAGMLVFGSFGFNFSATSSLTAVPMHLPTLV